MTVMTTLRQSLKKRAAYQKLKYELAEMPVETAIDLGLFREDAAKTASKAIYG